MNDKPSTLKAPSQLRVELMEEPYAIDTKTPSFSWAVNDAGLDEIQSAYRILITNRLTAIQNNKFLKDTGWVESSVNTSVKIDSIEDILVDSELYYWQVQTKNKNGKQSPFSAPKPFRMGIGDKWRSTQGIWTDFSKHGNFAFFRSPKIKINSDNVEKAVISMAARGTEVSLTQMVDLYINGNSVGFGPARDSRNAYYNSYDVTYYIRTGDNVVGALAVCQDKNIRAILIQMDVYYKDGTKEILVNSADGNWKSMDGTKAFGDEGETIGTGCFSIPKENINVAEYPENWCTVDFDDSDWKMPIIRNNLIENGRERILVPYTAENTLRFITDEPEKSVHKHSNANWIIDLGKEIIGSLLVELTATSDCLVTVRMGEQMNEDGSVRYHLAASPIYEEYWTLRMGKNIFKTALMKNFRYIELIGFEGNIEKSDIKGWAMRQDYDVGKAYFSSSNQLLNREYDMSKYSIQATNQDLFVDSQARERRAYEGDLLVNSNTSYVISDNYALARHSNEYLIDHPTWPLDYHLFSIEMAWQDYLYTGNADSLYEYYEKLKEKLDVGVWDETIGMIGKSDYDSYNASEIASQTNGPLIDWPVGERDGYVYGKYSTIFNAEYVGAYTIMSRIAGVIGDLKNKSLYLGRAERIRMNLIEKCYDSATGAFYDSLSGDGKLTPNSHYSLHASAYALAYGIFDNNEMKEKLNKFVGNDGEFKGSIYATYFILRGLYVANGGEQAATLLTNASIDTTKTFAYILDVLKATISPEAWSNSNKGNLTLSHPWGSSPGCSIVQGMFGILPTTPGFNTFNIKVQSGDIQRASVKTPSIKGDIAVSYEGIGREQILEVMIPANTQVKIYMSKYADGMFYETSGKNGTSVFEEEYQVITVGSGKREFAFKKYFSKYIKKGE